MDPDLSVTAVILAGGQASRMGGQDKGLIQLNRRPLIEYVIDAIAPQVNTVIINANRNLDKYRRYGYPVIHDRIPDYAGPLAGILTALQQTRTEYLLCIPCDSPWLPHDLRERLQSTMQQADAEITCVHDGNRLHPVFALLRQSLDTPLADYIEQGGRAVQRWFASRMLVQVDFSDCAELFLNINTVDQLQRAADNMKSTTG